MSEENKAVVRRWVEAVDELLTDSYVCHDPNSPEVHGPEEEKRLIAMYLTAFPDLHFTVEDMVAEGDKVATRIGISATHRGELLGIPRPRSDWRLRQWSSTAWRMARSTSSGSTWIPSA